MAAELGRSPPRVSRVNGEVRCDRTDGTHGQRTTVHTLPRLCRASEPSIYAVNASSEDGTRTSPQGPHLIHAHTPSGRRQLGYLTKLY